VVSTIISYKFSTLSRKEIDKMLGITFEETRVYQEAKEEGRQLDRLAVLCLLLNQKLGPLPKPLESRISALSFAQLEGLTNALLSFNTLEDLTSWLKVNA
jgi:predicted transposase YdaD